MAGKCFKSLQANSDLRKIPLVIMSGRKEEVTEKIPEPFEYFEFLGKPFDQKQLIGAIKSAMTKAKQPRPEPAQVAVAATSNGVAATSNGVAATSNGVAATSNGTSAVTSTESGSSAAEIQALNEKIAKMQAEIDALKKQLNQVVTFIKQKVK